MKDPGQIGNKLNTGERAMRMLMSTFTVRDVQSGSVIEQIETHGPAIKVSRDLESRFGGWENMDRFSIRVDRKWIDLIDEYDD